jgi:putative ABC transport system permease protein
MFQHNLLLIFRNFKRFKSTFFINLIGLSSGLACTLLIYLWINDELHVDKFHEKDSQLFQVMENAKQADGIATGTGTPDLLAETMMKEMPEVEYAIAVTPYSWFGKFTLTEGETNIKATGQYVSKDYFNAFSYPLTQGDKDKVLADKYSIVISKSLATKLFKTNSNVIGKTLDCQVLGFKESVIISGIFDDASSNSSEQFDFVLPFELWKDLSQKFGRPIHWDNHGPNTFVVLRPEANPDLFNKKIAGFIKEKNKDSNVTLFAVRYSDQYLYGKYENGVQSGGRIKYVQLFSIIALFILGIACINFMNLSTAKASRRIKEVGIKKAIGASRKALIYQYLGESMMIAFLSLALAIVFVEIFLPQFNLITGKHLALRPEPSLILSIFGITFFTGLLSGSYPALYLSGFSPALVLKGKLNTSIGELFARKGLVVFQFTLSVILIVSVLVVYKQIEFVQTQNLGYDKDHIIYFDMEGKVAASQDAFFGEVKNIPGIMNASSIGTTLMGHSSSTSGLNWEGKNPSDVIEFENVTVNYDMIETLGITMNAGRSFSRNFSADDHAIVLNEAAIKVMGLESPVGKTINLWGENMEIIGVAKNFHFESLHEQVKPLFFLLNPKQTLKVMVKIEAGQEKETIDRLKNFYSKFNPGYLLDYKFLDQDYQAQYVSEKRVSILSRYFAGLAIVISCLGLFGLAAFTAERRLKEIGIRKILGSSQFGIVYLLSSEFARIVFISIIIALPLSYLFVKYWLDSFAFRIELEWWYFVSAGLMALFIVMLTVGMQAVKAASVNPVHNLRAE